MHKPRARSRGRRDNHETPTHERRQRSRFPLCSISCLASVVPAFALGSRLPTGNGGPAELQTACSRAISLPTAVRSGRPCPAPWPAGTCTRTLPILPAGGVGKDGMPLGSATPTVVQPRARHAGGRETRKGPVRPIRGHLSFSHDRTGPRTRISAFHDLLCRLSRSLGHGARQDRRSAAIRPRRRTISSACGRRPWAICSP